MRFHWGLAVGHIYTHHSASSHEGVLWPSARRNNARQRGSPGDRTNVHSTYDGVQHRNEDISPNQTASAQRSGGSRSLSATGSIPDTPSTSNVDAGLESEGEDILREESEREEDSDYSPSTDSEAAEGSDDDEEVLAFDDMYGDVQSGEDDD